MADSIDAVNNSDCPNKEAVCIVGYALNAKKLRKSESHPNVVSSALSKDVWNGGGLADILNSTDSDHLNVHFEQWDNHKPNSMQTNFNVIIHKLTEDISRKEPTDRLLAIQEYLNYNPNCTLVDSFESVQKVVLRSTTYITIDIMYQKYRLKQPLQHCPINQPRYIIVNECHSTNDILHLMNDNNLTFPIICKPDEACGTPNSHSMVVVVSPRGFDLVRKRCVLQQYHNHNGQFLKVYVIGDQVMVFRRQSLPNLNHGLQTFDLQDLDGSSFRKNQYHIMKSIAFDSRYKYPTLKEFYHTNLHETNYNTNGNISISNNDISSGSSYGSVSNCNKDNAHSRNKLSLESDAEIVYDSDDSSKRLLSPEDFLTLNNINIEHIHTVASEIRSEFGLSLFGFDLILTDNNSSSSVVGSNGYGTSNPLSDSTPVSNMLIVDINYFPSYKEVVDFPARLKTFLRSKMK